MCLNLIIREASIKLVGSAFGVKITRKIEIPEC